MTAQTRDPRERGPLTNREREILDMAAADYGVREMAARLVLGKETIRTHRKHAMHKLGCHTMAGAVAVWLRSQDEAKS